jgi:hypothetical protein
MATGTKGELANVNTSASILASLSHAVSARLIPAGEGRTENHQSNNSIHLQQRLLESTFLFISRGQNGTSQPSKYRRAISPPTLEISLSLTAERKTLAKPRVSGELRFGDPSAIG